MYSSISQQIQSSSNLIIMSMSRLLHNNLTDTSRITHGCRSQLLLRRFSSAPATATTTTGDQEKSVSQSTNKSKLSAPKRRRRGLWWGGNRRHNFPPSLSGLGNAFVQATANMNRLLESLAPWQLIRRLKEKEESYHIKYEMPGLTKDDVKITVEDGVLLIRGEHKEAEEEGDEEGEYWSAASYGLYDSSLMLPEDAKVEEITAEMKDGVLHVIIPKDETKKKNVKHVDVG